MIRVELDIDPHNMEFKEAIHDILFDWYDEEGKADQLPEDFEDLTEKEIIKAMRKYPITIIQEAIAYDAIKIKEVRKK